MWSGQVSNTWHVHERLLFSKFNSPATRSRSRACFQCTRNSRADLAIRCRACNWIVAHFVVFLLLLLQAQLPVSHLQLQDLIGRAPPIGIPFAPLRICSRYVIARAWFSRSHLFVF